MIMRTVSALLVSLLTLAGACSAHALSEIEQITKTNYQSYHSIVIIKVSDENGTNGHLKVFRVIVTPTREKKPENVSGELSVYREGKLVVFCCVANHKLVHFSKEVDASVRDRSVTLEFTLAADCMESSKFGVDCEDPEGSRFDYYWFYLKDFADAK
jgi:hypothetical protein